MTKSYFKTCDYCKEKIEMSDKQGKWLPYNLNNGPHDCRKKEENAKQVTIVHEQQIKEITLAMVLKKLESIGIKVNIEELFKNDL